MRLTRDRTAEPFLRDQFLRRERGQRNVHFLCSADHEQVGNRSIYALLYNVMTIHTRAVHTYIYLNIPGTYQVTYNKCTRQQSIFDISFAFEIGAGTLPVVGTRWAPAIIVPRSQIHA